MYSFAEILADWMKKRELNAVSAGPVLGVSDQTIYNWLHAVKTPPRTRFLHLADQLGVDADRLADAVGRDRRRRPTRRHKSSRGTKHASSVARSASESTK